MFWNFIKSGVSYDADAAAFFTASGLTDATQKDAVNQLVLDLKAASIWTPMKAIYPFVGGTAALHKWNLKDPQDTDAAFRITWAGAATHNANGVTWVGDTVVYGDTHFEPLSHVTAGDSHYSLYSKTNNANAEWDFGNANGSDAGIALYGGTAFTFHGGVAATFAGTSNHFFVGSSTDLVRLYKNGSVVATGGAGGAGAALPIFLGGWRHPGGTSVVSPSTKNHAFISFGLGLSAADITALNTAVTTYQTALGRQN